MSVANVLDLLSWWAYGIGAMLGITLDLFVIGLPLVGLALLGQALSPRRTGA